MNILRIEHAVDSFEKWKQLFENDPIGRKAAGVKRYRILRPVDDPNYVMIDLEFDSADEAERMHGALKDLWAGIDVLRDPKARNAEVIEAGEY